MDEQKALEWISDVLAVTGRSLSIDDTKASISEWDSMGVLLLLSRLEEDFGIIVSADDLARIGTVREICEVLKKDNAFSL